MTPQQMKELRDKRNEMSRQANALVSDKGSQTWTAEEKTSFDNLADEIGRLDAQIEAAQNILDDGARDNFKDAQRMTPEQRATLEKNTARNALDVFMRVRESNMSLEQAEMIRNTMSTSTGSEGGYTVPSLVSGDLIETLNTYNGIRRVASRQVTGNGKQISWPPAMAPQKKAKSSVKTKAPRTTTSPLAQSL